MRFLSAALPLAAFLLLPMTASAQLLKPLPPLPSNLQYRTIVLQHARPVDVLEAMHWQADKSAGGAKLPNGVSRVFALQGVNRLLIQATPDGYERTKKIVTALDIAPQQVKLTVRFAAVPLSQKLTVDVSNPNQALLQMLSADALFSKPILETADGGKSAYFSLPWLHLDQSPGITPSKSPELRLVPHINKDNTITLSLNAEESTTLSLNAEESTAQVLETLRTVPSSGTTVYDATAFLPPSKYRVFLFVLPTILSAGTNDATINDATMKVKP